MIVNKNIEEKEKKIIDAFNILEGDLEMSNMHLIEWGKKLEPLLKDNYNDVNLVSGCLSKVWLIAKEENNKVYYNADSNTVITKGLISLLIYILSGQTFDDIINAKLSFIDKAGLTRFIGTQRSNGLQAMIKQMKIYAIAFKMKKNK